MSNLKNDKLIAECITYFRSKKAYKNVFGQMLMKWKKYGRVAGIIEINEPSTEERTVIGNFLNRDFSDGSLKFSMKQFESALKETKFASVSVKELLEGYYSLILTTNKELRQSVEQRKKEFFDSLLKQERKVRGDVSKAYQWLERLVNNKRYGFNLILREYDRSENSAKQSVRNVCDAIEYASMNKGLRLAMLGTKITKNPHAFDKNTLEGKLLIQALSVLSDAPIESSEDIMMLYHSWGIKPDDISGFTTVHGVHLGASGERHGAYEEFIKRNEIYTLTLANLSSITEAFCKYKKVYIIENQMVFSHICSELSDVETALVCTSGRIKTASWILLDLLAEAGCEMSYSGDFDPEGLDIAQQVMLRYHGQAKLWCMDMSGYEASMSDESISETRLRSLDRIIVPELMEIRERMLAVRAAGYQEQLIERMLKDILY